MTYALSMNTIAGDVQASILPEEDLIASVHDIIEETHIWKAHVDVESEERACACLLRNDIVEIWLVCWTAGHATSIHDHGDSAGAVSVIEGTIKEQRYDVEGKLQDSITHSQGQSFAFSRGTIHNIFHIGPEPAVTIHAYSPPLSVTHNYAHRKGEWRKICLDEDELNKDNHHRHIVS